MAEISHQRMAFADFKLRMFLFLCLVGIISASDLTLSVTISLNLTVYDTKCPEAIPTIKKLVTDVVSKEPRKGAFLLRLHFHDCFVQGCDASVLLKDTANFTGEQGAAPNLNSLKGFDVIDNIKTEIEKLCPDVVSCADILAVAARDSVAALGGIGWDVKLGRKDSTTASLTQANTDLPSPFLDLNGLIAAFKKKKFNVNEMVALSGAHTIGKGRCLFYRSRIYNEKNIDPSYAKLMRGNCPDTMGVGDNNLGPLDNTTEIFDSAYYSDLMSKKGLFHSDQQLYNEGFTDSKVELYAANPLLFKKDFAMAMQRMSNLDPLTGRQGQIRKVCSRVN